jgi:hypothetical protein
MLIIKTTAENLDRVWGNVGNFALSAHLAPIGEALKDGVNVFIIPANKQSSAVPSRYLRKPFLAIIGDDLFMAEGPAGFHLHSLRKVFARAQAVWMMAGKANRSAYEAAADGARAGLRVLIIETRPEEEASWLDYAKRHAPRTAKFMVTPNAMLHRGTA